MFQITRTVHFEGVQATTKGASTVSIDEELIEFMCDRFAQCDCLEALDTCAVALKKDIEDEQPYTLVADALDRMRAAYSKRLAELKGK